jgi:hypothetical protein
LADRYLGRLDSGCCERVQAVAREHVRLGIGVNFAGVRGIGDDVSDQMVQVLLSLGDVLVLMQQGSCRSARSDVTLTHPCDLQLGEDANDQQRP